MNIHELTQFAQADTDWTSLTTDYIAEVMAPWPEALPKNDRSQRMDLERGRIWGVAMVIGRQLEINERHDLAKHIIAQADRLAGPFVPQAEGPDSEHFLQGLNEAFTVAMNYLTADRN
ncbi:hypothetical protein [Nocardioides rubriscoriae]|uniref:hypothetical protein n=1 Tax=Nocardioides rubriscoriae TaxID=642762 RepID=UPI0011E0615E|nr:hypothetical protein [Nocardioides rubriscoriae]